MAKPNRLKLIAETYVPQTIDDCAADIRRIGDLQRQALRAKSEMDDAIAEITERYQPVLERIKDDISPLQAGVQTWCEGPRDDLTKGGKVKTAQFVTGEVQWRQRPPSVSVRGVDAVIEALKQFGLARFVRTKEELNKEAILNEPEAVSGIAGLSIKSGVEDFVIAPFEVESA